MLQTRSTTVQAKCNNKEIWRKDHTLPATSVMSAWCSQDSIVPLYSNLRRSYPVFHNHVTSEFEATHFGSLECSISIQFQFGVNTILSFLTYLLVMTFLRNFLVVPCCFHRKTNAWLHENGSWGLSSKRESMGSSQTRTFPRHHKWQGLLLVSIANDV